MKLIFDKERCGEFAANIIGCDKRWGEWFACVGAEQDGELKAVAVFNDYTGDNIEISVAAKRGELWATKQTLGAAFRYAFVQLGVARVTAHIRESNTPALFAAKTAGFKIEGKARKWFGNEDAILFGMLKSECRYIN